MSTTNNNVAADNTDGPLFILEADDAALDQDTQHVMNSRITDGTRDGYERCLVKVMLWAFDDMEQYGDKILTPSTVEKMKAAHLRDKERRTQAGRPSKKRDYIREECKTLLKAISKRDESTIPIRLENLNFDLISRFLATLKRVAKGMKDNNGRKVVVRLKLSSYEAYCSALSHLFTECGKDRESTCPGFFGELSKYKKGARRLAAKERRELGLRITEGKKPLPLKAYRRLAEILFNSEKKEYVQAHTFLVLDWNMISRSESVIQSMIDLISQSKDSINIDLGKTKCDQEGLKYVDYPIHIYSNPQDACICPFMAVCRLLICHPMILNGRSPLFEGVSQYERFHSIFKDIISSDEYRDEFVNLGITPEEFGTHSIRKGGATHCATGCTVGPPISSICLRASWSLPGVLNRYIKIADAGDEHVGKMVSGRDRMSVDFAESQPYFDFSEFEGIEYVSRHAAVNAWIKARMPVEARSNESVFSLFKACIASLTYHKKKGNLDSMHSNCPVRTSVFWIEDIPFADSVTTKHPWNATRDTPDLTGNPPDVNLLVEVKSLKDEIAQMKLDLKESFKEILVNELDSRSVGGGNYAQSNIVMDKLDALLERAGKLCDERTSGRASRPFDDDDEEDYDDDDFMVEYALDEEDYTMLEGVDTAAVTPLVKEALVKKRREDLLQQRNWKMGVSSEGILTPLPPNFSFPKMNMNGLITKWFLGDRKSNIPPLRFINANNNFVAHIKNGKKDISKMGRVMEKVRHWGVAVDAWPSDGKWDGAKVATLYSKVWPLLDPYLITEGKHGEKSKAKSRREQNSWRTCYNKMVSRGLFEGGKKRKAKKKTNDAPEEPQHKKRKKGHLGRKGHLV